MTIEYFMHSEYISKGSEFMNEYTDCIEWGILSSMAFFFQSWVHLKFAFYELLQKRVRYDTIINTTMLD